MSLATSNRDGGRTNEAGHLRSVSKALIGQVLTGLETTQRAAGANMSVDIAIGDALIQRSDGTYGHPAWNDAVYNQVIAAADGSNPRRDIVVMYIDYTQTPSTGVANNTNGVVKIKSVPGTAAGSPVDPSSATIQSSVGSGNPWVKLARVRLAAGATSVSNSVIDDLRELATGLDNGGWVSIPNTEIATWAYSSWSSTTRIGIITVPTDATAKYQVGNRLRILQSTGGTKYGIIVAVSATTLTVFFQTGTTLNNEAILKPYFSRVKTPFGFNSDPTQWSVSATDSTNRLITDLTAYTTMTVSLPVGIGAWHLFYTLVMRVTNGSAAAKRGYITLSSDGSTETDPELTSTLYVPATSGLVGSLTQTARKNVVFTSAKTLLFMGKNSSGSSVTQMDNATTSPVLVYATCNYL